MVIFLGIMGELATIIGTYAIIINAGLDAIIKVGENGYKINRDLLDNKNVKTKKKNKLVNRILGIILLLVPGINLINASIKGFKIKKQVMDDPVIKETIVPMTEDEKKQFAKLDGKLKKLEFTILSSEIVNDFESRFISFTAHQINDEFDEYVKEMEKVKSFDNETKPLEVKPTIEQEIILPDQEEVLTDEQGPRLTKSMRP